MMRLAMEKHRVSFETAASRLPQDDEIFWMPSTTPVILRSAKGASRRTQGGFAAISES
jgi:hypothetical protein